MFFKILNVEEIEKAILIEKNKPGRQMLKRRRAAFSATAVVLLSSGFIAPFLGLLFFILHSVLENGDVLSSVGTVFMIVSIPLMLCGSHFLDIFEKEKNSDQSNRL